MYVDRRRRQRPPQAPQAPQALQALPALRTTTTQSRRYELQPHFATPLCNSIRFAEPSHRCLCRLQKKPKAAAGAAGAAGDEEDDDDDADATAKPKVRGATALCNPIWLGIRFATSLNRVIAVCVSSAEKGKGRRCHQAGSGKGTICSPTGSRFASPLNRSCVNL